MLDDVDVVANLQDCLWVGGKDLGHASEQLCQLKFLANSQTLDDICRGKVLCHPVSCTCPKTLQLELGSELENILVHLVVERRVLTNISLVHSVDVVQQDPHCLGPGHEGQMQLWILRNRRRHHSERHVRWCLLGSRRWPGSGRHLARSVGSGSWSCRSCGSCCSCLCCCLCCRLCCRLLCCRCCGCCSFGCNCLIGDCLLDKSCKASADTGQCSSMCREGLPASHKHYITEQ
mmetsp:Transcript_144874/g.255363  ORF Transcript_144874/g.255363 Transcript_144874/m.255363 type:complete len:233 (+) Transcript_144874:198-896(+)